MVSTSKIHSASDLVKIADKASADYHGQFPELESAIGMLFVGRQFGWKVLYLIHSKATIRKYERILGISVREMFPEVGPLAHKSVAFKLAQKFSSFWKLVNGAEPSFTKTAELR